MKKYYYAVRKGRKEGIYNTWDECNAQVKGFAGAQFKKFASLEEAQSFINLEKKDYDLEKPPSEEIIAYVDGSYNQTTKVFGYGVVLIDSTGLEVTFNGCDDNAEYASHRNVAGEVYGSMRAIEEAIKLNKKKLYLHFDYMGIASWALGEWKANKVLTQNYKKFIDEKRKVIEIEFIKVKAHSNDKYNDMADSLAKEACGIV